ncbi:MAG: VOC family protein, partial [Pseudomonadota bacterium]
ITFHRKALGFKPAVWHGALTGGLVGRITHFDNDTLVIEEEPAP